MPEEPRAPRRRGRGRRRGPPRPQQAPARPEPAPALREQRAVAPRDRRAPVRRGGRGRQPRAIDAIRPGTPCLILVDAREGEPDRTGAAAAFEGFFDFESGEPRRAGTGIPRLRVGDERLWGFECWWRLDPQRTGLTDSDRMELEESKRLLRGLMRDARRSPRMVR
ncbi:MAG TPA: hypothetical protein VGQ86_10585 [Candidatus Limnocylindria bacterium]|nr:hypothetical protein [Candidatus Limnocylindria bacterium]